MFCQKTSGWMYAYFLQDNILKASVGSDCGICGCQWQHLVITLFEINCLKVDEIYLNGCMNVFLDMQPWSPSSSPRVPRWHQCHLWTSQFSRYVTLKNERCSHISLLFANRLDRCSWAENSYMPFWQFVALASTSRLWRAGNTMRWARQCGENVHDCYSPKDISWMIWHELSICGAWFFIDEGRTMSKSSVVICR